MNSRLFILIMSFIFVGNIFADGSLRDDSKYSSDRLTTRNVGKFLGWMRSKKCGKDLCCGHYFEPSSVINNPNPKSIADESMEITSKKPAVFTRKSASVIEGDVVLSQPGREITADKVTFFRDEKTGKIKNSVLEGDVHFREYKRLIIADKGEFNFSNKQYSADRGIYRLFASTPTGLASVWGRARHAITEKIGVLKLSKSTYTSCAPDDVAWSLWSNKLTIDQNANRGTATNAFLFVRKVPVFYTPYVTFPLDKRRESGFLYPTLTFSKDSGYGFDLPYYFNLAPNYDFTFTPEYFTRRGLLLNGLFRYLTKVSEGSLGLYYIPSDKAFINYRNNASLGTKSKDVYERAFEALKESRDWRGLLSFRNYSNFSKHWSGSLDANYTTDDYFLDDFPSASASADNNQLLNRADIKYNDDYWSFLGRLQIFQTLHPITTGQNLDQYKRLPQLNLSGDFPDKWGGLDYRLDTEMVHFMHRDNYYALKPKPIVSGLRFNVTPGISAPIRGASGSITPSVQLNTTGYGLRDQKTPKDPSGIFRAVPMFSLDGNMRFGRDVSLFKKPYTQTLEPRAFYIFVPERNQDEIPVMDTYLPGFDINQLFRTNRFSGIDRIGDANQLALALTSRLLDDYGHEKFNITVGQIVSFHEHEITIPGNPDPLINEILSPLVGRVQYSVIPGVSAGVEAAWDPSYQRFQTASVNMQYANAPDRVVNIWYRYSINGDRFLGKPVDLDRAGCSLGWKIWRNWNVLGSINYNLGYKRAQNYLYGLEYNSCCWAARFIHSRDFIDIGANDLRNYDSRYYIQFLLKGFGGIVDYGNFSNTLAERVAGYKDNFATGV